MSLEKDGNQKLLIMINLLVFLLLKNQSHSMLFNLKQFKEIISNNFNYNTQLMELISFLSKIPLLLINQLLTAL